MSREHKPPALRDIEARVSASTPLGAIDRATADRLNLPTPDEVAAAFDAAIDCSDCVDIPVSRYLLEYVTGLLSGRVKVPRRHGRPGLSIHQQRIRYVEAVTLAREYMKLRRELAAAGVADPEAEAIQRLAAARSLSPRTVHMRLQLGPDGGVPDWAMSWQDAMASFEKEADCNPPS